MTSVRYSAAALGLIALAAAACSQSGESMSDRSAVSGASASPGATNAAPGPFDGMWVVTAPGAGSGYQGQTTCPPLQLQFQVTGGQVTGSFARSPESGTLVENSQGASASPLVGTVQPDGTMSSEWQGYHVTGKFAGDTAQLQWRGECGPRMATGRRVST
jgi:hypothetical protein